MKKISTLIIIYIFGNIIIFFISVIYSLNKKDKLALPTKEESFIINKYAIESTKIRLSSYPASSDINWDKEEKYTGEVSLKISIKESNTESKYYYSDINFIVPLDLWLYKDTGVLEFWTKGGNNYSYIESFEVYLKDKTDTQIGIPISQFIKLSDKWQYVLLSLSEFSKKEGLNWDGRKWKSGIFDWNTISRVTFSILPKRGHGYIEIFMDDLKIVAKNKIIYNLFSHFE